MRIRATVAAVSGALALSALAVPAAHAEDSANLPHLPTSAAEIFDAAPQSAPKNARAAAAAMSGPVISKVVVNGGKSIVLGTTAAKKVSVSVTASHPSGVSDAFVALWHGKSLASEASLDGLVVPNEDEAKCAKANKTTSTCKLTFTIKPGYDLYKNALAGTWKVWTAALADNGVDVTEKQTYSTVRVQRASKLTVDAAPEPVKKGKTLTVKGKLSRANWETFKYQGYTGQPVKLQFRKKNSKTYTTIKTIKTNSTGNLKTTVKASASGYWRYSFAGTSTTPAINAAGDYVAVR
ncbi:DUF5707 domain-containing protein [Streptomyces sp. NPDC056061]|uniref:DUF5707 domain-containing protein n=1 Tax=Streptomyces sp. NPDC056061 TaxID=3345700 RepID=UPI0035DC32B9